MHWLFPLMIHKKQMSVLSDREFVNMRIMRKDFPEKGDVSYFLKSVLHPGVPQNKKFIRGWFEYSWVSFKPVTKNSTEVFMVTAADFKVNPNLPIFNTKSISQHRGPFQALSRGVSCRKSWESSTKRCQNTLRGFKGKLGLIIWIKYQFLTRNNGSLPKNKGMQLND